MGLGPCAEREVAPISILVEESRILDIYIPFPWDLLRWSGACHIDSA